MFGNLCLLCFKIFYVWLHPVLCTVRVVFIKIAKHIALFVVAPQFLNMVSVCVLFAWEEGRR